MLIKSNTDIILKLSEEEAKQLCKEIDKLMKDNTDNMNNMTMLSTVKNSIHKLNLSQGTPQTPAPNTKTRKDNPK